MDAEEIALIEENQKKEKRDREEKERREREAREAAGTPLGGLRVRDCSRCAQQQVERSYSVTVIVCIVIKFIKCCC